ncbi:MAG: ribosomal protein S18-alanine N-acetyltransferase [Candidatus Acidiferrum sp.]
MSKHGVRLGREDDLAAVEAILQLSPEASNWTIGSLTQAFEQYPSYFLVAAQDEQITGFISGRRILDEGEILNLAVKPSERSAGVGKALVQALLERFGRENVLQVFLEVRESNLGAIAFYQGFGFRQVGKRTGYYRNPVEAALMLALRTGSSARSY